MFILEGLNIGNVAEKFWTDSRVVPETYVRNITKRFKVFVANWVQKIQEDSNVKQWNYVKDSPVDDTSRGLDPRKKTSGSRWFTRPALLWQREELWRREMMTLKSKRTSKSMQCN